MPQTNQNKVGVWLPNPTSPIYSSFWPAGDRLPGVIADFNFAAGDTYASAEGGFSWLGTTRPIATPAGETEAGGVFSWGPNTAVADDTDEERFIFSQMSEFWFKMRFFIPDNYFHRAVLQINVTGDISAWQIGDTVAGTNPIHTGQLYDKIGSDVFLLFAGDSNSSGTWTGTVTNTTRSQSRSATRIFEKTSNNKLLALWSDGYSGAGTSPSIVWITWPDGSGGSTIQYQYAADNVGSGQLGPNSSSPIVPFFTIADAGKWINFIVHVKMGTTATSEDGIIESWKKVDGEGSYTKLFNQTNAMIGPRPGAGNFREGYVHGWANSGFQAETFHYDSRITLSSTAIDGVV